MFVKVQVHASDKAENAIMGMMMDACANEIRDTGGSEYEFTGQAERIVDILIAIRKLLFMRKEYQELSQRKVTK